MTSTDAALTSRPTHLRRFLKGHGTENDFVLLPDENADLTLDPGTVAWLCDRHRGIGADGVLRVARTAALVGAGVLAAAPEGVADDDWFMDYRNADGSIAEMCGNGVRVFAHHLRSSGLVADDEFTVGSRAGARPVVVHSFDASRADVSVWMGPATVGAAATARFGDDLFRGVAVDVGNPHLACVVPDLSDDALDAIDLGGGVRVDPPELFPDGVNVEVLTWPQSTANGMSARMRVLERGVGETRSCGTGLVAATAAALAARGEKSGEIDIDVPGGRVQVRMVDGDSWLCGPSELVAEGTLFD